MRHKLPTIVLVGFPSLLLAACVSSTPGANPHDMSAPQHEAMAANEDTTAKRHAQQSEAGPSVERCKATMLDDDLGGCWTSDNSPDPEHLGEAKKHRQMAADHRAASQALRDAEARTCVGLRDEDRDTSPFAHREDIASVTPLTVNVPSGKGQYARTEGAIVTFRAVRGMSAQWLQRVIDCHLARNAAFGHSAPEMNFCPLALSNVAARVTATDAGFAVALRSDDEATRSEILRRSSALVGR